MLEQLTRASAKAMKRGFAETVVNYTPGFEKAAKAEDDVGEE